MKVIYHLHKLHSYLKKRIIIRRKKRYRQIKVISSIRAFFRAGSMVIESWILGEKAKWDYQYTKTHSPIERKLYNALKNKYRPKTQVKCGRYSIDIAIPKYKIAIETDGKAYHSSYKQKKHNRGKTQYLEGLGWTVLRFSGSQVNGKMGLVIFQIEKAVLAYKPPLYKRLGKKLRKALFRL
ncbi:endonuclease domain-containing protein [Hazenella coriacea]|uniref:Very-short-patch-repair endonuclease n=1 Tax=Hazenella coriacea TaxID=1179467 RepID=A0A4R3LAS7_9BACL|nr:DUF559 domain-containing protein [Hazenella coriacea]TCS96812.1 very-short-patch-repair endonuclease [Hazenella coriacea]